jgi:hypothetical protein
MPHDGRAAQVRQYARGRVAFLRHRLTLDGFLELFGPSLRTPTTTAAGSLPGVDRKDHRRAAVAGRDPEEFLISRRRSCR